ncbi:hypothetical protein ACFVTC_39895 [Streptomyces sp. NPDC057950]|uniref:hypothetical protein n=1 Tax=Streptomyces sp. NPDC057950 TaxID=3346288 RepID=UPI0036E50CE6
MGGMVGRLPEGALYFLALEVEVGADGLCVGELPVEVGEDRAQAGGIRRQIGHAFDYMGLG